MNTDTNNEILHGQAILEVRRAISAALDVGMTQQEIIKILESAIGVLKSGDMR